MIAKNPASYRGHTNLGIALSNAERHEASIREHRKALQIRPDLADARNNLGEAFRRKGRLDEAIEHFRQALLIDAEFGEAHYNLGLSLRSLGRMHEAAASFSEALRVTGHWPDARYHLARTVAAQGHLDKAVAQFRQTLLENPDHVAALNEPAWLFATNQERPGRDATELQQAVTLAERAARLTGRRNPWILDTLAAAYAATRRFDDAVQAAGLASEIAMGSGQETLAKQVRERLDRYQRAMPVESGRSTPQQRKPDRQN